MIEYMILVAMVAVASLGIVKIFSHTLQTKMAQVTLSLQGRRSEADATQPDPVRREHYKQRTLEDFYETP